MVFSPISFPLTLACGESTSGVVFLPQDPAVCYILAHGAGAGMEHRFLVELAQALAQRRVATLRFNFPFMEKGLRRVDGPELAHDAVRSAVAEAARRFPGLPLFAGGKSFGGRMTSQAQAQQPLEAVRGLVFVGFPLHTAGKPSTARAAHLQDVELPMLFLQGTRDALAELPLVQQVVAGLGERATLHVVEGADHGFEVLKRSGRAPGEVMAELADGMAAWMSRCR